MTNIAVNIRSIERALRAVADEFSDAPDEVSLSLPASSLVRVGGDRVLEVHIEARNLVDGSST